MSDANPTLTAQEKSEPRPKGLRHIVVRLLASLSLLLIVLVVLFVCTLTIWQAVGGPAYVECLISSIEPNQCSFGQQ